jgi:GT2 family glycosyltransferase
MKKKILVSVVISNFNGERFIKRCLGSIFLEKGSYEVILVDNGSTDRGQEVVMKNFSEEKKLRVIRLNKNLGGAEARNIGVKNSRGKYLFFMDNDTKVAPGWYKKGIKFFEKHKKAGAMQVKILKMGTDQFDSVGDLFSNFGFLVERMGGVKDEGQFDKYDRIFALKTAGAWWRREVFDKLDGFDSDYYFYCEDTDLAWRTWLLGYEVYFVPEIVVWHVCGRDKKDFYKKYNRFYQNYYLGSRNTIRTLVKNLGQKRVGWIVFLNTSSWLFLALFLFLKGEIRGAGEIGRGVGWNFLNWPKVLKKRKIIQKERKINDEKLFRLVGVRRGIGYYFGKAWSYISGKPF